MRKDECDPIRRTVLCVRTGAPKLGRNYGCWRKAIVMAGKLFDMEIDNMLLLQDRAKWRRQLNEHMAHAMRPAGK